MEFLDAVEVYFRGERNTGYAVLPIGLLLLAVAFYLVRNYGGGLGRALGVVIGIAGLAAVIGGPLLARTVDARQRTLAAQAETDPGPPIAAEKARIAKVNSNWTMLKRMWIGLAFVALIALATIKRDWVVGLALAVVCLCAFALVVDTFAEKRALIYEEQLERIR